MHILDQQHLAGRKRERERGGGGGKEEKRYKIKLTQYPTLDQFFTVCASKIPVDAFFVTTCEKGCDWLILNHASVFQ